MLVLHSATILLHHANAVLQLVLDDIQEVVRQEALQAWKGIQKYATHKEEAKQEEAL